MMRYALLTLALVVPLTGASAQAKKGGARTVTVALPDQITWGPAPAVLPVGAKLAVLEGDPTKSAAFTMRLFMPDGYQIAPHFHPATEHVTVISGALMFGTGETFDESQMKTLPAGRVRADPGADAPLREGQGRDGPATARYRALATDLRPQSGRPPQEGRRKVSREGARGGYDES